MGCDRPQAVIAKQLRQLSGADVGQAGQLYRLVPGIGDRPKGARLVGRGETTHRVQLERDLVGTHRATIPAPSTHTWWHMP